MIFDFVIKGLLNHNGCPPFCSFHIINKSNLRFIARNEKIFIKQLNYLTKKTFKVF